MKKKIWTVTLVDLREGAKFLTEKITACHASDVRKIIKEKYPKMVDIHSLKY